jgi:hypothetical protein
MGKKGVAYDCLFLAVFFNGFHHSGEDLMRASQTGNPTKDSRSLLAPPDSD